MPTDVQPVTRRLEIMQTRDAIRAQVAEAKKAKDSHIDHPIELIGRSRPSADTVDIVFFYHRMRTSAQALIVSGRSLARERVRLYVPFNPLVPATAVITN